MNIYITITLFIESINLDFIRSLKPENVLIDREGYIKITDFGLSKENISDNYSAFSFCGTPEYLAPEIIENKGHGKAVDWWSLGAIIFEMLTGLPPFYQKDRDRLFKSIKTTNLKYPSYLSQNAIFLLQGLFVKDPGKRLGSGPKGVEEIKSHVFFKSIDWKMILAKKIKPPFLPKVSYDYDTPYVDPQFTCMTPVDSLNPADILVGDDNPYSQFTYDNDEKPLSNIKKDNELFK